MPRNPHVNIRSQGSLRTSKDATAAGPADEYNSPDLINADGTLIQKSNQGTPVSRVMGDGRRWGPILTSPPANPTAGEVWLEQIAGVTYLMYADATNTPVQIASAGPVTPTIVALTDGVPTNISTVLVDAVGSIEWAITFYNPNSGERHGFRAWAVHDGTLVADATTTDLNLQGTASVGAITVSTALALTGAGAGQEMELNVTITGAGWFASISVERMTAP